MSTHFKATLLSILVFLIPLSSGFPEAIVLPVGSTILFPDSTPNLDLHESMFLLTRSDMIACVGDMKELTLRKEQIQKLEDVNTTLRTQTVFLGGTCVILILLAAGFALWR